MSQNTDKTYNYDALKYVWEYKQKQAHKNEKKMYQEGRKAVDCFFIQISFNTKANTCKKRYCNSA